jgi:ketosteroid isomerase-like protein
MSSPLAALGLAAALAATSASAQTASPEQAVAASLVQFTEAMNRGDVPAALAHFAANPTITEDLAPYRFSGPEAGATWVSAMGANGEAHGVTAIDMALSPATRVEVSGDLAYAVVPGLLTWTMKDGSKQRSAGTLTFALQRTSGAWLIHTATWTGPALH